MTRRGILGTIAATGGYALFGSSGDQSGAPVIIKDPVVAVETGDVENVTTDGATVTAELTRIEDADSADVYWEYWADADDIEQTSAETVDATTTVSRDLSGLTADTEYSAEAIAEANSAIDTGEIVTFTTTGDDSTAAGFGRDFGQSFGEAAA